MTNKVIIESQRTAKSWSRIGWSKISKNILLYVIITIIAFIYILPVLGVILTSFKLNAEIAKEGLWTFQSSAPWTIIKKFGLLQIFKPI